jgi:enoyl ACP reductase
LDSFHAVGILEGKRILVTGVLTDASLAFSVAKLAQEQGADIVLSGAGRGLSLTRRTARKLPTEPEVLEIDVTSSDHLQAAATALGDKWGSMDGLLHAIGFAPESCLGGDIFRAEWDDVAVAMQVSAYSLKALVQAFRPLLVAAEGASVVGLDFDARVAWPAYDWMGVAKAALESLTRYLARDLGPEKIRVNLVAAGPVRNVAARSIKGFSAFEDTWAARAPLGWDVHDGVPVAQACVALMSDWFPMTTGEMVHVDGGAHALGA